MNVPCGEQVCRYRPLEYSEGEADTEDPPERKEGMSYVDLHLHLLPGVDDGPADEEQAVR